MENISPPPGSLASSSASSECTNPLVTPEAPRLVSGKRNKTKSFDDLSRNYRYKLAKRRVDFGPSEATEDESLACLLVHDVSQVSGNIVEVSPITPSAEPCLHEFRNVIADCICPPPILEVGTYDSTQPTSLRVDSSDRPSQTVHADGDCVLSSPKVSPIDCAQPSLNVASCDLPLQKSAVCVSDPKFDLASLGFDDLLKFADKCSEWDIDFLTLTELTNYYQHHPDEEFDPSCLFTVEASGSGAAPESELRRVLNKYIDDFDDSSDSDVERDPLDGTLAGKVNVILRDWTLSEGVIHFKVTKLLRSLKALPELSGISATAESLVKTPKAKAKLDDIPGGGQYYHLGIEKCLSVILKNVKGCHVTLYVNTDGISIYKSKGSELWPILCRIISIDGLSHIVFPIGFYYHTAKPTNPFFLKKFSEEAKSLITNGLVVNGQFFSISVEGLICDAPGKAVAIGVMAPNGKVSCTKCHVEGVWSHSAHRTYFNDDNAAARTHDEFLKHTDKRFHKYVTPLEAITTLSFPRSIPLDVMHLLPLGVCRTIVFLWLVGKAPYNIGAHGRAKVGERTGNLKYFCPKEFGRKPRDTHEAGYFKATEWFQILLYTGMVVFRKVVPGNKYDNFICLCVAVRIILDPKNRDDAAMIAYARGLFLHFLTQFRAEYNDDFVTHNFHALIHVCDDLETFGNLIEASAFRFENFMQYIKFLVNKTSDVLAQLARRFEELFKNGMLFNQVKKEYFKVPEYFSPHSNGPLMTGLGDPQYGTIKYKFCELTTVRPDNCCTVGDEIVLINNICFDHKSQKMSIMGLFFRVKENFFSKPCESSKIDIYKVSKLSSTVKSWPVDKIVYKNYLMPVKDAWIAVPLIDSSVY